MIIGFTAWKFLTIGVYLLLYFALSSSIHLLFFSFLLLTFFFDLGLICVTHSNDNVLTDRGSLLRVLNEEEVVLTHMLFKVICPTSCYMYVLSPHSIQTLFSWVVLFLIYISKSFTSLGNGGSIRLQREGPLAFWCGVEYLERGHYNCLPFNSTNLV